MKTYRLHHLDGFGNHTFTEASTLEGIKFLKYWCKSKNLEWLETEIIEL